MPAQAIKKTGPSQNILISGLSWQTSHGRHPRRIDRSRGTSLLTGQGGIAIAKVVIVGGGPAGLACAAELSSRGICCTILERKGALGGRADMLSCKGEVHCRHCDVCQVHRLREQVLRSENVSVITNAELEQVERSNGRYRLDVQRPKEAIDLGTCSRCGKCVEACPTGAMAKVGNKVVLDRSRCRSIQGLQCELCVSVCPTGSIDLFGEEHLSVCGDAVVVATGSLEFPAQEDRRLGWGEVPGVITSMELESYLEGRSALKIKKGSRICFVLCVGSRTCRQGTEMCSAVCCKYALRQALRLKEGDPSLDMTMFVMDWRGVHDGDPLMRELEGSGIKVVRSRPAEIVEENGRPCVRYADDEVHAEAFDVAVLAVGLVPDKDNDLVEQLALPRDEEGNLVLRNCRERGIFLAGSCLGPKDIRQSMTDGTLAAKGVLDLLEEDDG